MRPGRYAQNRMGGLLAALSALGELLPAMRTLYIFASTDIPGLT
jgi:hypothetical protein